MVQYESQSLLASIGQSGPLHRLATKAVVERAHPTIAERRTNGAARDDEEDKPHGRVMPDRESFAFEIDHGRGSGNGSGYGSGSGGGGGGGGGAVRRRSSRPRS